MLHTLYAGEFLNKPVARKLFLLLLLGLLPVGARATHIVGGHLEMKALNQPGHFRVSLIYYFDELQTWPAANDALVVIYRQKDNALMDSVRITNQTVTNRPPVVFANEACAELAKMKISMVRYEGDIYLDPNRYDDSAGYYLAYQTCCRNGGAVNIQQPNRAGYLYYLEFPALMKNGKPFTNSSPAFGLLDGEYICIDQPFAFNFKAFDVDGDQLRYSITTPLYGFQDQSGNPYIRPAPYPEVQWVDGYGPTNEIPGSPPLSIDSQTGELTVKASKLGLFVFAIRVEEFRNGQKIGEVRRDYQFLVLDCPPVSPPEAVISLPGQPVGTTEVTVCDSQSLQLQATVNASWNYQWKLNGSNIPGATTPTITATEAGEYALETSLKNQCSQSKRSTKVTIRHNESTLKLTPAGGTYLCDSNDQVTLTAPLGSSYTYTWSFEGNELSNENTSSLIASLPGKYTAILKDDVGCIFRTDTISVAMRAPPQASVSAISTTVCRGDSLALRGSGGIAYEWLLDDQLLTNASQPVLYANRAGEYRVRVSDSVGCSATSPPIRISLVDKISVTFDSVQSSCGLTSPALPLRGYPAGGTFSGPGVSASGTSPAYFIPAKAGIGQHEIIYTVVGTSECQSGRATRLAVVATAPSIGLPTELNTWKGGTLQLRPVLAAQPVRSKWQPTTHLTHPDQAVTQAVGVETDISYTLEIENEAGCRAEATVRVTVQQRIGVPNAFTPNGDGLNDYWELKGIETYPEAEVFVFNRWGQVIFYAKGNYGNSPFDGNFKGQILPAGIYTYVLNPMPNDTQRISGALMLIR